MCKKLLSVLLVITLIQNYCTLYCFAEDDSVNIYEYHKLVQQFSDSFDHNSFASGSTDSPLNRLIVKTNSNTPLENDYGAIAKIEGYNGIHILQYESELSCENAYLQLNSSKIEFIEHDFMLQLSDTVKCCYCPNDPAEAISCKCYDELKQEICTCPDTTSENHFSWSSTAVQVDEAFELIHNSNFSVTPISIGVVDSGIQKSHEHFTKDESLNSRICVDENYTCLDNNIVYPSDEDDLYHGTHVAGIIFDNTMDTVEICSYRVTTPDNLYISYMELCACIDAAVENNIGVINMSLVKTASFYAEEMKLFETSVSNAIRNNVVIVAASGNRSKDANVFFPASYKDVITVSSAGKNMLPDKSYSNYGSCVDISAPGTDIYSTTPRVPGVNDADCIPEAQSLYMRISGTSMASPLVAAAAATLKSISPDMSAAEIQRIIKETAYVPEGWDTQYGTGIVNFYNMVKQEVSGKPTIKMNSEGKVEITAPEGTDSRLYYTLDGSVPTIDNHLVYTEPFSISGKNISVITAVCHENGKLIGEAEKYRTRSYYTLELDYKETVKPLNADAKWFSWDSDVATVDSEGNITGAGVGKTTVTAVLESGKRINYVVCVEYTKLQWFIRIFLLGFLWY